MRFLPLLMLAVLASAADPEVDLRAAHAARAALEAEERAWSAERERMQAAIDGLRQQTAEDTRLAAIALEQAAKLRSPPPEPDIEQRRKAVLQPVEQELARLKATALPQTLEPRGTSGPVTGLPALAWWFGQAAAEADSLLAAAQRLEPRIESGRLDRSVLAVRTIRSGLFHGWWLALDGSAAGSLQRGTDGLVLLHADPDRSLAIRSAFAQLDGREPPHWVMVPHAP